MNPVFPDYEQFRPRWYGVRPGGIVVPLPAGEYPDYSNREIPFFDGGMRVAWDEIVLPDGNLCQVSTVFLYLDHGYDNSTPPVLFETMVFRLDGGGEECERYTNYKEAHFGHLMMIQRLLNPNLNEGEQT